MPCLTAEQIDQLARNVLDGETAAALHAHLQQCEPCRRKVEQAREGERLLGKLKDLPENAAAPSMDNASSLDPTVPASGPGGVRPPHFFSPPPDSFAGYQIIREVHRGGQGVVYQAVQKSTKRKVAIKVMKEGAFASRGDKARFEREVEILGQLNHPNIVSVHDSGQAAGSFYFVMDYISGQPLDVWMASREQSVEETLRLFQKICEAVHAAHLKGIIHRDLKPGNIRIDDGGEPYVLDFGLAKIAHGAEEASLMTMTGQFMGSLPWASPEQAEAKPGKIDMRTDVYSLGVVLYQMLTGKFPYDVVGNMRDVLDRIMKAEPARPSTFRVASPRRVALAPRGRRTGGIPNRINDEVDTIVLKCLSKERERRYQSAGELARDIGHYLCDEPIEAKRDSAWYVVRKHIRRYRVPAAILAGFAVLITISLVALSLMYHRQTELVRQQSRLLGEIRLERDRARNAESDTQVARNDEARQRQEAEDRAFEAQEERKRAVALGTTARMRFEQSRALARAFIFEFDAKIANLPGAEEARQLLVDRAMKYLDTLASEAKDDKSLLCELAEAYVKVGDVQGRPGTANLGKTDAALASYGKAHGILEELLAADAEDRDALYCEASRLLGTADVLARTGHTREASKTYASAQGISKNLARDREDSRARQTLALSHLGMAEMDSRMGLGKAASEEYRAAVSVSDELLLSDPQDNTARRIKATGRCGLGDQTTATDRMETALSIYRDALADFQRICQEEPGDIQALRGSAQLHVRMGDLLLRTGTSADALEHYREAERITNGWSQLNRDAVEAMEGVALVDGRLADFYAARGRLAEALRYHAIAQDAACRWAESQADDVEAAHSQAESLIREAFLRGREGRVKDALSTAQQAVKILTEQLKRDPDRRDLVYDIAIAQIAIGDLSATADQRAAPYREAIRILEDLSEVNPANKANKWTRRDLGIALRKAGDNEAKDNAKAAKRDYEKALQLHEQLANADPGNSEYRYLLAVDLSRIGRDEELCRALDILQELFQNQPDNMDVRFELAIVQGQLGRAAENNRQPDAAVDALVHAADLLKLLLEQEPQNGQYSKLLLQYYQSISRLAAQINNLEMAGDYARKTLGLRERVRMLPEGAFGMAVTPGNWAARAVQFEHLAERADDVHQYGTARKYTLKALDLWTWLAGQPNPDFRHLDAGARLLLTCRPMDLRDPKPALDMAIQAVHLCDTQVVEPLLTLALAYEANGDPARAAETLEQALPLLPPGDKKQREQIEERLAAYRRASSQPAVRADD